jgi:hypothetical protein
MLFSRQAILGGALMLAGSVLPAHASGPIPCLDCPQLHVNSYPETGLWYNPDEPGTGFMFEVQGGILVGYYYLYDEQGQPQWLMVTSPLIESDIEGVMWELEAELLKFSGGPCLDCDYSEAQLDDSPGTIRLEFFQRNAGRFQVGELPFQEILTLTYGAAVEPIFEPFSDLLVPNLVLSTYWVLGFSRTDIEESLVAEVMSFSRNHHSPDEEGLVVDNWVNSWNAFLANPDMITRRGTFRCYVLADHGPRCEVSIITRGGIPRTYHIHPGNLGDARFIGESYDEDTGVTHVIEGFRLEYD